MRWVDSVASFLLSSSAHRTGGQNTGGSGQVTRGRVRRGAARLVGSVSPTGDQTQYFSRAKREIPLNRIRASVLSVLSVSLLLLIASPAWAQTQSTTGNILGTILDPDGGVLPGATITVTSESTGRVRTAVASANGTYRVPLLPPGLYSVRADLQGFRSVERNAIPVSLGSAMKVDISMDLASVQEVLIVTGQSPVVETSKTQVSTTISETAIDSLPILGRNFTDFTLLTPGALIEGSRNTIAISGQRGINTSVNVDGSSDNSAFFGYQRGGTDSPFTISQESVQEFQVITSGIMPEFGRSGGGLVNVVTKSGTNQWQGGGHFFLRDERFTGTDPFDREQTEFSSKQFGGSVGGPLARNETFAFFSADAQVFGIPYFVDYDLDAAQTSALEAYVTRFRPAWDINQTRFTRTNDTVVLFGKLDHSINDDNQVSLRVNFSDHETIGGGTNTNLQGSTTSSNSSLGDQKEKTISTVLQVTSVLGERAFNEFRVQYAIDDLDRLSNDLEGPDTDIRNPFMQFGRRFFMPIFVDEKKFQVQNNFSYLFDNHDIKAGFDFETDKTSEFFAGFAAGEFRFNSLDEFMLNEPSFMLQRFGGFNPNDLSQNFDVRQTVAAVYLQDSWRVNDHLTVNYGVRWEGTFNPTPIGNPDRPVTQQIPDDLNNFQPRFGFAYSPDPRTVLRSSVGVFYSRTPTILFFNPFTSTGEAGVGIFFFGGFGGELDGLWPNLFPSLPDGISATQEIYWFDPSYQEARTIRINAGVEREIVDNLSLGVSYVHARADGLQSLFDSNLVDLGLDADGRRLYGGPIEAGVEWRIEKNSARSRYNALIFEFKKRFSDGWGMFSSYTLAKDEDNDSNERSATGDQPTDIFNLDADFGSSDRDIRHRFVMSAFADLPAGFKIAGTFTARSGQPYNGILTSDVNGDNETNDRPAINGSIIARNSFEQPSFSNVDLRLTKQFATGAGQFQFFAEVFNALNSENLYTTRTQYDSSHFGDLNTFIGNVRQLQLGFRWAY